MKTAVVLGGTLPHIDLIAELKSRGYHTVLVDYFDNPPAKDYADEFVKKSTLDKEAVLAIATKKKANLVISSSVDQANAVCCYVAEKLDLPRPYSYEVALNVTDKSRMKAIMMENGIRTPGYRVLRDEEGVSNIDFDYPVVIKPADSNSAKGVKKIDRPDDIKEAYDKAKKFSRNGKVIVEEFVEGPEISAYGYIMNHEPYLIMTQERLSVDDGENKVVKCYASIAPARISSKAYERARIILGDIASAFDLDNTSLFFQGIVKNDDIYVLEFAPRTGGGISTKTIKLATDFDLIGATVDSYLGEKPKLSDLKKLSRIYAVNQVYAETGIIGEIRGVDRIVEEKLVDIVSYYKQVNDSTDSSTAGASRVFVMVVSGDQEDEVLNKIDRAFHVIDVIDTDGNSIIRRDLTLPRLLNQR